MKNSKLRKVLLLACSAVLLVCLSVGATLAYLTSQTEEVKNTFTVGKVAITLDEALVTADGEPAKVVTDPDTQEKTIETVPLKQADRVKANDYKLMPGHTYTKDPTVTVKADSEDCYIRAFVTISKSSEFDKLFSDHVKDFTIGNWVTLNTDWTYKNNVENDNNTRTYEVWYKGGEVQPAVTADTALAPIFSAISVPGVLTNKEIETIEGAKITVVAQAIQADGFSGTDQGGAAAAWAAFDVQATSATNP